MTSSATSPPTARLRLSPTALVSFALCFAGLVLGATVDMAFLILFGLGAFGAPLLREAGLLRDHDEFQRAAARLAGYRAYLAGGLFLVTVTVVRTWGTRALGPDEFSASSSLTVMLMVYLLSYLTSYWGAQRAAFRILLTFGAFWLVFTVLSHGAGPLGVLAMELLVSAPFFVLAFTARSWPRTTGAVLTALAIGAFFLFDLGRALTGDHGALSVLFVLLLPLLFCGLALLAAGREESAG